MSSSIRIASQAKKFAGVYRDEGLKMAVYRFWRWAVFWSPLSPLLLSLLGDVHIEKLKMHPRVGYWPHIRNPRTFNEKLVHRKLFSDREIYTELADKWRVRQYVRDRVGDDILNDVYCVTDTPDRIPFETLPREFVVKPTHKSGAVRIVADKQSIDTDSLEQECREWLSSEFGKETNEYWYLDIDPKIIVEKRLKGDFDRAPLDYKFFVFHGRVELIEVDFDRFGIHKQRFFDRDWEPIEMRREHPQGPVIDEPERLDEMRELAESLGSDFDFVRVDLYSPANDRIVFGELTFSPSAGYRGFQPPEYDFKLGELW